MSRDGGHPDIAQIGEATQFGKGQDPRENGAKAATWSIRNMVRYFGANDIPLDDMEAVKRFLGKEPTNSQKVALKGFQKAIAGDMRAIEYVTDQIDGKVAQRTELTGADGGPIDLNNTSEAREYVRSKLLPPAPLGDAGSQVEKPDGSGS